MRDTLRVSMNSNGSYMYAGPAAIHVIARKLRDVDLFDSVSSIFSMKTSIWYWQIHDIRTLRLECTHVRDRTIDDS